jgi:hypothetical protein
MRAATLSLQVANKGIGGDVGRSRVARSVHCRWVTDTVVAVADSWQVSETVASVVDSDLGWMTESVNLGIAEAFLVPFIACLVLLLQTGSR